MAAAQAKLSLSGAPTTSFHILTSHHIHTCLADYKRTELGEEDESRHRSRIIVPSVNENAKSKEHNAYLSHLEIIEQLVADDGELNSNSRKLSSEEKKIRKHKGMSSSYTQVEQQQNVAPPALDAGGEPQDVGAVVLKAKKAAASLWMILHAQVS